MYKGPILNWELSKYFQGLKNDKFSAGEWNFFVENYGKNPCESLFSLISTWLTSWFLKFKGKSGLLMTLLKLFKQGKYVLINEKGQKIQAYDFFHGIDFENNSLN
jgi:hypothetical protein